MNAPPKTHQKRFVLIDSHNLIHRGYHAYPSHLRTPEGVQINAVFGFTSMLLAALEVLEPDYLACAFDIGKPTWRHAEFMQYKKHRKEYDSELKDQIPLVKDVARAFNIPVLEFEGFEADDVVGTIAEWVEQGEWKKHDLDLIIVSGDRDILQVVSDHTRVWLPRKSFKDMVLYDEQEVEKLFGFGPELVPDYKALVGDPSDNIPGVSGIGKVMGGKLIREFGQVEKVYKNLEKVDTRARKKLEGQEEIAFLSKKIATIVRDVPVDVKIEDCITRDFNLDEAMDLLKKFGFRSLVGKVSKLRGAVEQVSGSQINMFAGQGNKGVGSALNEGAVDLQSNELSAKYSTIIDLSVKTLSKTFQKTSKLFIFYTQDEIFLKNPKSDKIYKFPFSETKTLDALLSLDTEIWGFDLKEFYKLIPDELSKPKVLFKIFDLQVLTYLIDNNRSQYSFDSVIFQFLRGADITTKNLPAPHKASISLEKMIELHEVLTSHIKKMNFGTKKYEWGKVGNKSLFKKITDLSRGTKIQNQNPLEKLFRYIDNPSVFVLAAVEQEGITVDKKKLRILKQKFTKEIQKITQEIYKSVGHEFNINSTKQLQQVLFEELQLPKTKRTKTGYSTNEESLTDLVGTHPLIELILHYREISKILSTYIDGLLNEIEQDGRIRTNYNHFGTTSGRLSSISPNLQNIPIRGELASDVRSVFVAAPGQILVEIDYSQVELRVLAHISGDKNLLETLAKGIDMHARTASRIFNKKSAEVSKDERRIGKIVNFGVVYGQSAYGLAKLLKIPAETAAEYIKAYFAEYPKVEKYLSDTVEFVQKNTYVETFFGRRRYIYDITASNRNVQLAAQREAVNMPIQGSATGDVMRLAMIEVFMFLKEKYSDYAKVLLQVHDELVFEVAEDVDMPTLIKTATSQGEVALSDISKKYKKLAEFIQQVNKIMQNVVNLEVSLDTEIKMGKDWSNMTVIK